KLGSSTFEAWIKTDYKDAWTTICKTIGSDCHNLGTMIWGIDINRRTADFEELKQDPLGARIIFAEDFIQLYVASLFKNKAGCRLSFLKGEFPISDGEWHHLVYTTKPVDKNGAEQTERALFIDGTLNRISEFNPQLPNTQEKYVPFSDPVYLGAGNNRGRAEGFFNGIIDEVRIYDRPLTEAEIMHNYQSKTGLPVEHKDKLPTVWGALKKR
ncbi:MAG: LamG domain-containing protein, partial [Candidatus Poribacteria bacterium]|nr:LamG domain-containing protein [Candidatus Poribacteria bacterium]